VSVTSVEKDYDRLTLTLTAEFEATIEAVWQLWEDPRKLERWWGPPSHPATVHRHELKAGGEVTYSMAGASGGWWRITAVEPPHALEFTDGWAGRDGPTTDVRVRLAERDGGTRMELRFTFSSSDHMEQVRRAGAFDVFPQSVAQMQALLTKDG
jgi:uncharacterized protein YndB with AHSA1/START domain